ncbi:hypothetical protein HN937_28795 [Candidatus Poribacteria bacterium]|jgi:DNA repair photolyase|nr:hypothetical protein [Candidatus Poribacteria bacterium]
MPRRDDWIERPRKSAFIKRFPSQIANGEWCPGFDYASPGFGCSHDCKTCFMHRLRRGRMARPNEIYTNVEAIRREVLKWQTKHGDSPRMIGFGSETTDIIADRLRYEAAWGISPEDLLVELFEGKAQSAFVLTKGANLEWWATHDPIPNLVLTASVNGSSARDEWEQDTPPMAARLRALSAAMRKGWRVRVRVDPLQEHLPDFAEDLQAVCRWIQEYPVERVTCGVLRVRKVPVVNVDRQVAAVKTLIDALGPKGELVATCKTHLPVLDRLGLNGRRCNCML